MMKKQRFISMVLSIMMVASLTLGGALAARLFLKESEQIQIVVKTNDILPSELGETT